MKLWQKTVGFLLIKLIYNLKVLGSENVENITRPVLIISNHKHILDSFALGAAVSLRTKILPVKIMGAVQDFTIPKISFLYKIGLIKLIYSMFDVFPAVKGKGLEEGLKAPINFLQNGKNVFMHPEGKMVFGEEIGQFKRGAPFLALKTKVPVLPIAFKIKKNGWRKTYCVNFGRAFTLPESLTSEQGAEEMREKIVELYKPLCG